MNRSRKWLSKLLPVAVSLGLIGLGIYLLRDSFPELFAVLRQATFLPLLLAFLAHVVATFLLSQRMRRIFATVDIDGSRWDFFYYLLIATFTSNFFRIPGGASLITAVVASTDRKAPFQVCLVSSLADRLIGTLTVPVLAAAGLWWAVADPETLGKAELIAGISLTLLMLPVILMAVVPKDSAIRKKVMHLLRKIKLGEVAKALAVLLESPKTLAITAVLTGLAFLSYSACCYLIARSFGFNVPFHLFLVILPTLAVALVIPSVGGWGVRESVFIVLLRPYLAIEEAVAISIVYYAVGLATSLLGGFMLATKGWPDVDWSRFTSGDPDSSEGRQEDPAA
jgi:uncharacterized membrane protein YbhN (UPF0104 family)